MEDLSVGEEIASVAIFSRCKFSPLSIKGLAPGMIKMAM